MIFFPIPYTISYTVVCCVSQFNPYNKDENNKSIISIIYTTLATGTLCLHFSFFIYNSMNGLYSDYFNARIKLNASIM